MNDLKTIKTEIFDPYYFRKDDVYCIKYISGTIYTCLLKFYSHNKLVFSEVGTDHNFTVVISDYQSNRIKITKMISNMESVYFDDDIQVIVVRDTVHHNWVAFNSKYDAIEPLCDLMDNNPELYKKKLGKMIDDKVCYNAFGIGNTPNDAINNLMKEIKDNGRIVLTKSWMKENKNK